MMLLAGKILLWAASAAAPNSDAWPFAILRSYGSYVRNRTFTDRVFAAQERHPGLFGEIWFSGCGDPFSDPETMGRTAAEENLAALTGPDASAEVRRQWCAFNGETLGDYARIYREAAEAVSPKTRLGIQGAFTASGLEGMASAVRIIDSKKVVLDGPIVLDSACWMVEAFNSADLEFSHLKVTGAWRYNANLDAYTGRTK